LLQSINLLIGHVQTSVNLFRSRIIFIIIFAFIRIFFFFFFFILIFRLYLKVPFGLFKFAIFIPDSFVTNGNNCFQNSRPELDSLRIFNLTFAPLYFLDSILPPLEFWIRKNLDHFVNHKLPQEVLFSVIELLLLRVKFPKSGFYFGL
jgi:hypothetical protein